MIVGVRVRPILKTEQSKAGRKDIIRVVDGKIVVVLDPDESKVRLLGLTTGLHWASMLGTTAGLTRRPLQLSRSTCVCETEAWWPSAPSLLQGPGSNERMFL